MKRLSPLYLARQNISRRPFRSAITIVCVVVIVATLFGTQIFTEGVAHDIQVGTDRMGASLIVVPVGAKQDEQQFLISGKAQSFYMNESALQVVRSLPEVEAASPQIVLTTLSGVSCCATGDLQIIAIDPSTDFTIIPWLSQPLRTQLSNGQGIVGIDTYSNFGSLQPQFFGRTFDIVGKLQRTDLGLDDSFFITMADAQSLIQANMAGQLPHKLPITVLPGQISDIVVKLKPGIPLAVASDDIMSKVPNVDVVTSSDITQTVQGELNGLLQTIYLAGAAVWAVALIMIGAVFSMSVNERQREIGLLRALGSTSNYVFGLITLEGALLTITAGLIGLGVGGFAIYVFNGLIAKAMGLAFVWPTASQFIFLISEALAIAVVIGVFASLYPAYKSSRMEPYSAMRQE